MNSFRGFIKQMADKAELVSPTRSGSDELAEGQEGFICPACHRTFGAPDDLQLHFEAQHGAQGGSPDSARSEPPWVDLQDELQQLQRTLQTEQSHSTELQRQVEALSQVRKPHLDARQADESQLAQAQIDALTEGRALLTQEVGSLRQQLAEATLASPTQDQSVDQARQAVADFHASHSATVDDLTARLGEQTVECQRLTAQLQDHQSRADSAVHPDELIRMQTLIEATHRDHAAELAALQTEADQRRDQTQTLVGALKAEVTLGRGQVEALTGQVQTLTRDQIQMAEGLGLDVQRLQDQLAISGSQSQDLTQQLSVLQRHYDDQSQAHDELKGQWLDLKSHSQELQRNLEIRQKEVAAGKDELDTAKAAWAKLNAEKSDLLTQIEAGEGVNTAWQQLTEDNATLTAQLQAVEASGQALSDQNASKIEKLYGQLSESEKCVALANEKIAKLEHQMEEKSEKLDQMHKSSSKLEAELHTKSEVLHASEASRSAQRQDLEGQLRLIQSSMDEKSAECKRMAKMVEDLQMDIAHDRKKAEETAEVVKRERGQELSSHQELLQALQTRLEEQKSTLNERENAAKGLQGQLEEAISSKSRVGSELHEMKEELQSLQTRLGGAESENHSLKTSLDELKAVRATLETAAKVQAQVVEEISAKLSDSVRDEKATNAALRTLEEKEVELLSTIDDQVAILSSFKKEAGAKVEAKQSELEAAKQRGAKLEDEISKMRREAEDAEAKICKLQSLVEQEKFDRDAKISDLGKAKKLLLSAKVDLQNQLEAAKTEIEAKDRKMSEIAADYESRRTLLESEKLKVQKEMEAQKEEQDKKVQGLDARMNSLVTRLWEQDNLCNEQSALVSTLKSSMTEMNAQMDAALGAKLEMEAQLGSASDERKSLLERCLLAENELERSRGSLVELRRKLDDSQAALHELGRENQSIQVELAKQNGRKWADDSDVVQCQGCSSPFTLTNRKHHCRNCGRIFCAECSAKQAPMPNYKKPQRVCDQCHGELQ